MMEPSDRFGILWEDGLDCFPARLANGLHLELRLNHCKWPDSKSLSLGPFFFKHFTNVKFILHSHALQS